MIKIEEYSKLESVKDNPDRFRKVFLELFIPKLKEGVSFMEELEILQLFYFNSTNELRVLLDNMSYKAQRKMNDAIENGQNDEIYESRYKKLKDINDLFTYYCEEI